ncbi:glycosyltransferase family 4 protein [Magnetofaba australis]|uniref:Putative group 1 glycosyl transferase n=1 Tax=Magnetofaba australis IT-1 TaxID=1434232 RepID=A0A1Y2K8R5_9PROT|nr:glycosyltransferase family 4 protein [Magnetofaba australis]OSM07113.1 putative group 1 glycosyl transferase [Magnetofaba australis IT-1]
MSEDHSTAKPSVLFLLNTLTMGGSERKHVLLANWLHARGWRVEIAYLKAPHTLKELLDPAIPLHFLDRRGKWDPRVVRALSKRLREGAIETLWAVQHYPIVYAFPAARLTGRRLYCSLNKTFFRRRRDELKMALYAPLFRRADRLLFGCEAQMRFWMQRYALPSERCGFIHNGVDAARFDRAPLLAERERLRAQWGVGDDEVLLGAAATFRPVKRLEEFLEAGRRLMERGAPLKLALVGDGPEADKYHAFVRDNGLAERVILPGRMMDVRPALAAFDGFVLSSIAETFSNAALEAMAMGLPVVISDAGGAPEMVFDGDNGYRYPPGDAAALSDAMARLLDAEHRHKLGQNARATVLQRFTFERMARQVASVLESGHE